MDSIYFSGQNKTDAQQLSRNVDGLYDESGKFNEEKAWELSNQFSSLFYKMMYKNMRATLHPEKTPFYGGHAEKIFTDMIDSRYAEMSTQGEKTGLSKLVFDWVKRVYSS